jgi:hypothetical protein
MAKKSHLPFRAETVPLNPGYGDGIVAGQKKKRRPMGRRSQLHETGFDGLV